MKLKRIIFILFITIVSLLVLAFVFISPIAKYEIEKNSEQWIGRKVKIEKLWVNLFTGSFKITGLKVFEHKSEKVFFSCKRFYLNISVRKLLASKYDITEIKITKPEITITQKGNHFNYDDLLKRFADSTKVKKKTKAAPAEFWVRNFSIDSAVINYSNNKPQTSLSMVNLNTSCPLIAYNDPAYLFKTDFDLQSGGNVNAAFHLNSNSLDYHLQLDLKKLNIAFLYPYLRDYIKINSMDGLISSNVVIAGNFNKPTDIASSGLMEVEKFSLVDTTGEKLTAVETFRIGVDSVNTKSNIYRFDTISFNRPYLKFAMYQDGYNFNRIMTEMATNTNVSTATTEEYSNVFQEMAAYVKAITREYEVSSYSAKKFVIDNGQFVFTDYTLEDEFDYNLDRMHIASGNLSSKNERINIEAESRLNNSGKLKGTMSVNPDGFKDMDINYTVKDLILSDINPYFKFYVATPFMDGVVLYESNTTVINNQLKSTNNLHVEKIEVGKKVKMKAAYNLPIRLAVSLLKDVKGNINLDIPVEGNLNDPKYKLGKVIWDIIKNLIIKAATAPFRLLANAFGGKEEDYKEVPFQYLQKGISEDQLRTLDNIVKVLGEKHDLKAELVQVNSKDDETEQLALLQTKKQYLALPAGDTLSEEQSQKLAGLSNKDSLFSA